MQNKLAYHSTAGIILWYLCAVSATLAFVWWNWKIIASLTFWGMSVYHMAPLLLLFLLILPCIESFHYSIAKGPKIKFRNPFKTNTITMQELEDKIEAIVETKVEAIVETKVEVVETSLKKQLDAVLGDPTDLIADLKQKGYLK